MGHLMGILLPQRHLLLLLLVIVVAVVVVVVEVVVVTVVVVIVLVAVVVVVVKCYPGMVNTKGWGPGNTKTHVNERNHCVSLLRKTKIAYYENLDERKTSDNRRFWKTVKTVKPSLSEKFNARERISLSQIVKL